MFLVYFSLQNTKKCHDLWAEGLTLINANIFKKINCRKLSNHIYFNCCSQRSLISFYPTLFAHWHCHIAIDESLVLSLVQMINKANENKFYCLFWDHNLHLMIMELMKA